MKVEQLMIRDVQVCHPEDSVNAAAHIMWERDCGCVPVVIDEGDGARVVGVITDRDICMAAYTQGRPLGDIPVASTMARDVRSCRPTDTVHTVLNVLRTQQLHRLPVVDANDHLVGILTLADLSRESSREHGHKRRDVPRDEIADTLEAIWRPRSGGEVVCAA